MFEKTAYFQTSEIPLCTCQKRIGKTAEMRGRYAMQMILLPSVCQPYERSCSYAAGYPLHRENPPVWNGRAHCLSQSIQPSTSLHLSRNVYGEKLSSRLVQSCGEAHSMRTKRPIFRYFAESAAFKVRRRQQGTHLQQDHVHRPELPGTDGPRERRGFQ